MAANTNGAGCRALQNHIVGAGLSIEAGVLLACKAGSRALTA